MTEEIHPADLMPSSDILLDLIEAAAALVRSDAFFMDNDQARRLKDMADELRSMKR